VRTVIVSVSLDVSRPRQQVFDLMADARNEPRWNSQVSATDLVSDEPVGAGSRFTTVNRGQSYDVLITTYTPSDELVFAVDGKPMTITGRLLFTDTPDGGTHLSAEFTMQPKGFLKVLFPLMGPAVRKDFPKQFASFKAFCEGQEG